MASINGIELKAIKEFRGHEEDFKVDTRKVVR